MIEIKPPELTEFMVRGYPLAEALAIVQQWDRLTPEKRGEYLFPLPLPPPRRRPSAATQS